MDISKYLIYLEEAGWSELICFRWKEKVHEELLSQYPDMTEEEWNLICDVVFWWTHASIKITYIVHEKHL